MLFYPGKILDGCKCKIPHLRYHKVKILQIVLILHILCLQSFIKRICFIETFSFHHPARILDHFRAIFFPVRFECYLNILSSKSEMIPLLIRALFELFCCSLLKPKEISLHDVKGRFTLAFCCMTGSFLYVV